MQYSRSSGVLLHISSLPSYGGIGDLGPAAHQFVDFLAAAKQHIWQVLPLCPTGYGSSPYAGSSAFAGNPSLISLEFLSDWGWIAGDRIASLPGRTGNVDFDQVERLKLPLLHEAATNFLDRAPRDPALATQWEEFEKFCQAETSWLVDYAFYAVLRTELNTGAWPIWPEPLRTRRPEALAQVAQKHSRALSREQVLQFAFSKQWIDLRGAAASHGIRILGDVAIFVNMDSADVWVHPEIFDLDSDLRPIRIAGVPPDYFSPTGQRWGNPLYKWDLLEATGFHWWIERIRRACELYDIVRLDHFRGFEAYWAIPADDPTAINGAWVKAPGLKLFKALEEALGPLSLVAEDLGLITPEVEALRLEMGMPGMKVIQFGFSDKSAHMHLPQQYAPATVAYTGTHDNDTTQGWWNTLNAETRHAVEAFIGPAPVEAQPGGPSPSHVEIGDSENAGSALEAKSSGDLLAANQGRPVWPLIRAVQASVAALAVVPAQDLLQLDSSARMNTPSVGAGNWSWRLPEGLLTAEIAARLAAVAEVTDRDNDPLIAPIIPVP